MAQHSNLDSQDGDMKQRSNLDTQHGYMVQPTKDGPGLERDTATQGTHGSVQTNKQFVMNNYFIACNLSESDEIK